MRAVFVKVLLRAFSLLPLPLAHALGAGLGWVAYLIPNGLRRVTGINLALCGPELEGARRRTLARRSLAETGKTLTEMGAMWFWSPRRILAKVRQVTGWEAVEAARAQGRGTILLTPHLGAWELTSLYLGRDHPITCLYRPPRMGPLHSLILRARERGGSRLVPTTPSGVKALYQALGQGADVGILPDQDPGRGAGVFAPFFGVPANTMTLVPRLVRSTGAAVVFVYAQRLPWGRGYVLHFSAAPAGMDDPDPATAAAAMNRGVERCIRACPEQYQWSYKRFKTRPAGADPLY